MTIIDGSLDSSKSKRYALEYLENGFSVIPVLLDGSKRPKVSWKTYSQRPPTTAEIEEWFSKPAGIGLVTGVVSQGFEVLDFDSPEIAPAWFHSLPIDLRERLTVVQTGSGGFQVYYRCTVVSPNTKIALEPYERLAIGTDGKPKENEHGSHYREKGVRVRIETRGEGGYVVAVGSPAQVHKSGRTYQYVTGPQPPHISKITPEERRTLWEVAEGFDLRPSANVQEEYIQKRVKQLTRRPARPIGNEPPWEKFDRLASWHAILEPHGWHTLDGIHWTRPGKQYGHSAAIRTTESGSQVLVVFSTSSQLAPEASNKHRTFGKFDAWKWLEFGGDASAAARKARQIVGGLQ